MTNDFHLPPDDPRLTAYALGELEPDERAVIEAALRRDSGLRAAVDDIRATTARLEAALAAESADATAVPALGGAQSVATPPAKMSRADEYAGRADEYGRLNGARQQPHRAGKMLHFPQLYYLVAGVAAACFAVIVAWRDPQPTVAQKKVYHVIDLRPDASATPPAERAAIALSLPAVAAADTAIVPDGLALLEQVESAQSRADLQLLPPQASALTLSAVPVAPRSAGSAGAGGSRAIAAVGGASATPQPFEVSESRQGSGATGIRAGTAQTWKDRELNLIGPAFAPYSRTDLFPGPRPRSPAPEPPGSASPGVTHNTEAYAFVRDNDFLSAARNPLSTFAVDVDTASYANVRRFIQSGRLPPADAVRIEELINYFPYRYTPPAASSGDEATPFAASIELAEAPWAPAHRLVRIGIKGREVPPAARPPANLVFLLDVSGSMAQPNKLPLVQESLRLLLGKLRPEDRVAIVTYAGNSGLALPSTPMARSREISDALDALRPGGSTNGAMGIQLAYDIARANLIEGGVNRVVLCTDGDFNVGLTSQGELVRLVEEKARSGVFLTVLGFGMGNLKDSTLELLADRGNGNYGYIDTRREAEKLLVEQISGTLVTIAKDVKIQVDFNPAKVASYRLIGYENRGLKPEDFSDDKVDAGEIGAGHTVTALYEIVPVNAHAKPAVAEVEESRYQPRAATPKLPAAIANELLTVRVRYKEPAGEVSRKLEFPLTDDGGRFANASADFKFTSALAAFGMILRDSPHKGRATIGSVIEWAAAGAASAVDDPQGYRTEFIDLARRAQALVGR